MLNCRCERIVEKVNMIDLNVSTIKHIELISETKHTYVYANKISHAMFR